MHFQNLPLAATKIKVRTDANEPLKVLGKLIINVSYEKKIRTDFRYTYLRSAV